MYLTTTSANEDTDIDILAYLEPDSHLSVQEIPSDLGMNEMTGRIILVDSKLCL